jgi:hypothetical protein
VIALGTILREVTLPGIASDTRKQLYEILDEILADWKNDGYVDIAEEPALDAPAEPGTVEADDHDMSDCEQPAR